MVKQIVLLVGLTLAGSITAVYAGQIPQAHAADVLGHIGYTQERPVPAAVTTMPALASLAVNDEQGYMRKNELPKIAVTAVPDKSVTVDSDDGYVQKSFPNDTDGD